MRSTTRRPGIVLALIPLVLAAAACSSTAHQAAPSAGTAPQDVASERYGFRLTLTKAWTAVDATAPWDGKELQGLDTPEFATFKDATTGRALLVAAAPVTSGTKLPAWRAAMVQAVPSICSNARSATTTRLDGEPAMEWPSFCSDGYDVVNLAALHSRRGYMLFLASPTQTGVAADHGVFESIRRSFRFDRSS